MSAIGIALDVEKEVFILLNSADIMFSAVYFIFLITIAQKVVGSFLKKTITTVDLNEEVNGEDNKSKLLDYIKAIALGVGILGIAVGLSMLILGKIAAPLVILCITTLGIGASFLGVVRRMSGSYESANYLLLVFAVAIGCQANFSELVDASSEVFYYCGVVLVGAILIHYLLAVLFKIDTDTVLITSTAAIFGPAFVGPVAERLKNKEVIVSGIAMGLMGYGVGNYIGLAVAWLLS